MTDSAPMRLFGLLLQHEPSHLAELVARASYRGILRGQRPEPVAIACLEKIRSDFRRQAAGIILEAFAADERFDFIGDFGLRQMPIRAFTAIFLGMRRPAYESLAEGDAYDSDDDASEMTLAEASAGLEENCRSAFPEGCAVALALGIIESSGLTIPPVIRDIIKKSPPGNTGE